MMLKPAIVRLHEDEQPILRGEGTRPPPFTDEALALRFAETHSDDLRYVATLGKWFVWTGQQWKQDETLRAFDLARKVCRQTSAECNKGKLAQSLASAKTVAAVERLSKADRRLAATIDQFDADPMALNTPSGVVCLRTGDLRGHRPEDYFTRMTASAPGGECPTWIAFLQRVCGSDDELIGFLRRIAGYSLTGLTVEHALFFLYGLGANGKSVFLNTIAGVLVDYHKTAPIETFTASSVDKHPTDVAGLRGARLVTAIETEEGRRWNESKVKSLTGGDKVTARFMRQDFFEFVPQFKLMIAGNHKPGLRSVDEAIRRRFNLIPFTVTIPPEERDEGLFDKLKAEWPGILQWMVDGCLEWQERGLRPPKAVLEATAEYLESEDALSAWTDECCEREPNAWTSCGELFASWKGWADKAGEPSGNLKRFSQKLEDRGFEKNRRRTARGFAGIRVASEHAYRGYGDGL
jgi:putative DNA primase/helicase